MYQNNDYIDVIMYSASKTVMEADRLLYTQYIKTIEQFCAENAFMIGGSIGIDMILGSAIHKDSFFIEIYGSDIYNHAKRLTDLLYALPTKHIDNKYIELKTDIKHEELTIYINLRRICKIYRFNIPNVQDIIKTIKPSTYYGYWYKERPIPCIPEELQLVDIYRNLYNPAKNGQWETLFAVSQHLYETSHKYLYNKIIHQETDVKSIAISKPFFESKKNGNNGNVHGADDDDDSVCCDIYDIEDSAQHDNKDSSVVGAGSFASSSPRSATNRDIVLNAIKRVGKYLKSHGIIIGDYAMDVELLTRPEKNLYARLQFIIELDVKQVVDAFKDILENSSTSSLANVQVSYKKFDVSILSDFRIKKWTIYLNENISLCDVFNSTAYEMVPFRYIIGGYKIGNPLVLIRFKFIDLWVMRMINNIEMQKPANEIQEYKIKVVHDKIADILESIEALYKLIHETFKDNPTQLFQLEDYGGVFISDEIAKKKLIKEIGFGPSYYPAKKDGDDKTDYV